MGNVIQIRREKLHQVTQLAASDVRAWEEGKQALEALAALGRGRIKVRLQDRATLARRLHAEVRRVLETRPHLHISDILAQAPSQVKITTKERYRLTLPPEAPPDRGLRADAKKYYGFIVALHRVLQNDLNQYAYELFMGTSLHPGNMDPGEINRDERLIVAARRLAVKVSKEFELHAKFKRTADFRKYCLELGGKDVWPFHKGWADHLPERKVGGTGETEGDPRLLDAKYAFWNPDFKWLYGDDGSPIGHTDSGLDAAALANLPHVHLGMWWDEQEQTDARKWWRQEHKYSGRPARITGKTRFDSTPRGVSIDAKTRVPTYTASPPQPAMVDYWIVLYPNQMGSSVEPVLWCAGGEYDWGHVRIEPLTLNTLQKLRTLPVVSREHKTLHDAFKSLFQRKGSEPADVPIYRDWGRTAPFLDFNPHLLASREDDALDQTLTNIITGE